MTSMVYIQDDHIHNQSGIDCYVDRHTSYVSHHQEVQSQFALDSLLYRPYKSLYNIYLYYIMEGFYIGLLLTVGVLGYREHKQLCKLEMDYKDLRELLNQQRQKQEKMRISLKDLFE